MLDLMLIFRLRLELAPLMRPSLLQQDRLTPLPREPAARMQALIRFRQMRRMLKQLNPRPRRRK